MWTEDEDEFIKRLWAKGFSASSIAAEINLKMACKYSRNAVIGRIHRMMVQNTKAPPQRRVVEKKPKAPSLFIIPQGKPNFTPTPIQRYKPEPRYHPKWECQYFIGDVKCGKESHGPWCEEHKAKVFVSNEERSANKSPSHSIDKAGRPFRVQNFR